MRTRRKRFDLGGHVLKGRSIEDNTIVEKIGSPHLGQGEKWERLKSFRTLDYIVRKSCEKGLNETCASRKYVRCLLERDRTETDLANPTTAERENILSVKRE